LAKERCPWIEPQHPQLSIRQQCQALGLARSTRYYQSLADPEDDLRVMRLIDEQYLAAPFYGSRKMTLWLRKRGEAINRKRVQRLMRTMGLEAIYPKPCTSHPGSGHKIYPYLLRNLCPSSGRTTSGRATSPMCRCRADSCT
jgi:putative transposase